ncbi:tRNA (guanosine(46)-N7)-methyltransferase TrmB [Microcoleus sp. FACHB-1515]|uniref:tRNA (guanosine(46)-N7)-methyltransferase TrmB n=1 Tax=Cyanophyceae TaxID=3028117 RepID=UPI001687D50B|nr:tRNA (guanosine(46)-N7)-methyltransferase TrmB [Microcoleus sp. FACHB-1515]MBD2091930.1 tRNA (guanosine(46)-N7)-methyltransferase TrmB [Microcoleus sp. FACHB-1515]
MSQVRVRQHVNPLSLKYQRPIALPDWSEIFTHPAQPLHLDIGCARGQFLLQMAANQSDRNFLGLEIREPLVIQANRDRTEQNLTNLHFLFCNVSNAIAPLLESYPGQLVQVSIQFPDPWFKKRHQKRRVVQPQLVDQLAEFLISGGWVFLQSDIEAVAIEMRDRFAEHSAFVDSGWLDVNPLPVPTEREQMVLEQGDRVYRVLFQRV